MCCAQVGQGFRDSKNYGDSWIAGCSSEFYWCMSRFYNKARNALNMSAALNGTGILLSADYMRRVGWHTSSLTEDLEFTAQCALGGVRIWWLGGARAYDEQPNSFVDSFKQRRRWAAGTVQCMRGYFGKLVKRAVCERKLQCLDMAVLFTGPIVQLLSIIPGVYFFLRAMFSMDSAQVVPMLIMTAASAVLSFIGLSLGSFAILKIEGKSVRGQWSTVFGLWLFLLTWVPANLISLFTKPPKWVQIPHERAMSMADLKHVGRQSIGRERTRCIGMKYISWNVNGLRACVDKGFMDYFNKIDADAFCLQETKLSPHQIKLDMPGYTAIWNSADKKGYSGTAIFSKKRAFQRDYGAGH